MKGEFCARCQHFSLKDAPQLAHGIGRCHGYDGHALPVQPFTRWDAGYCVNFSKAKEDMPRRIQWIEMQKRKEDEQAQAKAV